MYKYIVTFIVAIFMLSACGAGAQHSVRFIPTKGSCADGKLNAPYCMSIRVSNNESAQNFITSATPINNLTLTIHGADNILNPFSNPAKFDPNNCFESSIIPGESCVFFLQLSKESGSAGSIKNVDLEFHYTALTNLFNNDNNESIIKHKELQVINNIYIVLADPYRSVWRTNDLMANSFDVKYAESLATGVIVSSYLDNINYGYLDLSTTSSMFQYSMLFDNNAGNLLGFTAGGANNLISNGNYLYASGVAKSGVWRIDTLNPTWNAASPSYNAGNLLFAANIATISNNGNLYLVANNNLYRCLTNDNNSPTCTVANTNTPGGATNTINKLGFAMQQSTIIAGTNQGIFFAAESNLSISSNWLATQVTESISSSVTNPVNGQNFFGSNNGKIYLINASDLANPILFYTQPNAKNITAMTIDTIANKLLFTTAEAHVISLYSCTIMPYCSDIKHLGDIPSSAPVVAIHIGSELDGSDDNQ